MEHWRRWYRSLVVVVLMTCFKYHCLIISERKKETTRKRERERDVHWQEITMKKILLDTSLLNAITRIHWTSSFPIWRSTTSIVSNHHRIDISVVHLWPFVPKVSVTRVGGGVSHHTVWKKRLKTLTRVAVVVVYRGGLSKGCVTDLTRPALWIFDSSFSSPLLIGSSPLRDKNKYNNVLVYIYPGIPPYKTHEESWTN
jgi:hypothetical protein